MDPKTASGRTRFPYLSHEAFVSQTDKAALQNLQKLPLLPMLVRKFNEFAVDRIMYVQNSAESVRCGPRQFHTAYDIMREACEILHVAEPELYVKYNWQYNAYTAGVGRSFVVLHSSLMNDFDDEELRFVIGHEIGHIKAGHVLYQEIGRMLLPLLDAIGQATLGLGQLAGIGLMSAFLEWMRQAEISCDRAGLLVSQNPRAAFSATMKLGCGASRFDTEMDVDTFLEQARSHSESGGLEGLSKALLFLLYNWQLTHPQVVYRAKFLDEWHRSGAYERVLSGDYPRDATGAHQMGQQVRCPSCRLMLAATVKHCPQCGTNMTSARTGAPTTCHHCGAVLPPGTKFCMECGKPSGPPPEEGV